ncbi:MAG: HNH endonuclease [Candidatus Izimaplasma sp.]|nr:HNH endonuclease [Candidatus Izimaplasma bacterium]MCF7927425.1 HNH endonuclease [Candidatus Izimaplasma bacterium]
MNHKNNKKYNISGKRKCECCGEIDFLEEHHIEGRKIKNFNDKFNITNICPSCHYKIHLNKIILEGKFLTSEGYQLIWHSSDEISKTSMDKSTHLIKK